MYVAQIQGAGEGVATVSAFNADAALERVVFRREFTLSAAGEEQPEWSAVGAAFVDGRVVVATSVRMARDRESGAAAESGDGLAGTEVGFYESGLPLLTLSGEKAKDSDLLVLVLYRETGEALGAPRIVGTADGDDLYCWRRRWCARARRRGLVYGGEFGAERWNLVFDDACDGMAVGDSRGGAEID